MNGAQKKEKEEIKARFNKIEEKIRQVKGKNNMAIKRSEWKRI